MLERPQNQPNARPHWSGNWPPETQYASIHSRNVGNSQWNFDLVMWISAPRPPREASEVSCFSDLQWQSNLIHHFCGEFPADLAFLHEFLLLLYNTKANTGWLLGRHHLYKSIRHECDIDIYRYLAMSRYRYIILYFFEYGKTFSRYTITLQNLEMKFKMLILMVVVWEPATHKRVENVYSALTKLGPSARTRDFGWRVGR